MVGHSSSQASASHPRRLTTPPPRGWGVPITVFALARGHRSRTRLGSGDRAQPTSSPGTPTEPESSPLPRRHLRRTRVIPSRYRNFSPQLPPSHTYRDSAGYSEPSPDGLTLEPGPPIVENRALNPGQFF